MIFKKKLFILFLVSIFLGLYPSTLSGIQQSEETDNNIKIGLLIPDNKSLAARQGAELAIKIANKKNGLEGKQFKLVVKSMEGQWGTGSKQAVSLIFDDKVCAIMGSHDGRNAHLVEQATTKARVVFLSAWSGDPTLSKAFVPWFFNCVPNDNQQADSFIEEIYTKRKLQKIVAVSDNSYDAKLALESFIKRSAIAGKPESKKIFYNIPSDNIQSIVDQVKQAQPDALIFFGNTEISKKLKLQLKKTSSNIRIFCSLSILDEQCFSGKDFEDAIFISTGGASGSKAGTFKNDYQKAYGTPPGAVAAFSYDGMTLLINAIREGGTDRESIQKALLNINYEGVTGTIKFDEKGNRKGTPGLMQIKDGLPVAVEKY